MTSRLNRSCCFFVLAICGAPIAQSASSAKPACAASDVNGAMVLRGESISADPPSRTALQKITWTPQPDGRVRQLWESSTDSGKTWSIVFDGMYSTRM